ncbi:MAG: DUF3892 domain-containing protein [Microbacteriaceae bacterium]|nr:DUF3892 domain-containing protein [Microbacteriaceae bacterium]
MPTRITHVRFHRVVEHEAAISYRWSCDSGVSGESDRPSLVEWIDGGGDAVVGEGRDQAPVAVVRIPGSAPFVRTHADGQWTDRLLTLPRY